MLQSNGAQLSAVPGQESINIKITRDRKNPPSPQSHQGTNDPKTGGMKPSHRHHNHAQAPSSTTPAMKTAIHAQTLNL